MREHPEVFAAVVDFVGTEKNVTCSKRTRQTSVSVLSMTAEGTGRGATEVASRFQEHDDFEYRTRLIVER